MPHDMIRMSAYQPEVLAVLFKTFDEAWAEVAPHYGVDGAAEAARRDLAAVILELAAFHQDDPAAMKELAVAEMRRRGRYADGAAEQRK